MKLTNHTLLVLLLTAATAGAAPDPKAGTEFGFFVGTWKCQETWSKSPISEAHESTATLVAADNTDGVWVAWSYVQDAAAKNPHPVKGNDLWGYDPAKKSFTRAKADNYAPGVLTMLTSKGFVDGTVAWEGNVQTPKGAVPFKHTFKKLDDHTIEGHLFIGGTAFYQSKCTKS